VRLETLVGSENRLEDLDMTVAPQDIADLGVATVKGRVEIRRWLKETRSFKDRCTCSPCPPLGCIGNPNGFGMVGNLRERDSDWCPSRWVHRAQVSVIVTVAQMPISEIGVLSEGRTGFDLGVSHVRLKETAREINGLVRSVNIAPPVMRPVIVSDREQALVIILGILKPCETNLFEV